MRIRKGLLLSSSRMQTVSPTASDPQLNYPKTSHEFPTNHVEEKPITHSKPSDPSHQPPFLLPPDRSPKILIGYNRTNTGHTSGINQKVGELVKLEEASREEQVQTGACTRKHNIVFVDAPVTETVALTQLSSCHVDESWFDADKKIPPSKKRKGLASGKTSQETPMLEKAGDDDSKSTNHNLNVEKKINKRGGTVKEGSRCSRVNGRGWRCGQQTLVGYSLCEHHLGKGRLRSITKIKGRAKMPTAASPATAPPSDTTDNITNDNQPAKKMPVSSSIIQPARNCNKELISLNDDDDEDKEEDGDDDYGDQETKKPQLVKKKRMKLGMVKARSLSSLLNQHTVQL